MMPCNGHVALVHSSIMRCLSTAHTTNMLARPGYRIRKCVRRLTVKERKSAFDQALAVMTLVGCLHRSAFSWQLEFKSRCIYSFMTESEPSRMMPLRPWRPPPPPTGPLDWMSLRTISLADYDSADSSMQDRMKTNFRNAISEDGFLTLVDHGLSQEEVCRGDGHRMGELSLSPQIERQFELAQMVLVDDSITTSEKQRLRMNTNETVRKLSWGPAGEHTDGASGDFCGIQTSRPEGGVRGRVGQLRGVQLLFRAFTGCPQVPDVHASVHRGCQAVHQGVQSRRSLWAPRDQSRLTR